MQNFQCFFSLIPFLLNVGIKQTSIDQVSFNLWQVWPSTNTKFHWFLIFFGFLDITFRN